MAGRCGCTFGRLVLAASISPFLFARSFLTLNQPHSISTYSLKLSRAHTPVGSTTTLCAAAAESEGTAKQVLVPIANGSEEIESTTIIDTLVRAGAKVTVASVHSDIMVTCSRGVKIVADVTIEDCKDKEWDLVVCPGGMPGATHLKDCATLEAIIRSHYGENKLTAAICAAPAVIFASYGLLKDKAATCYPAPKFQSALSDRREDRVVVDGNMVTSQGPGTALEFSLKLVELLFGVEKSDALKAEMLYAVPA